MPFRRHNSITAIVKPGNDEPVTLGSVRLQAPGDTAFFLEQQGVDRNAETYYNIVVRDKRAYIHLCIVDVEDFTEYVLFYWTKSTAPVWLKQFLP